jgi:hypothetical protein
VDDRQHRDQRSERKRVIEKRYRKKQKDQEKGINRLISFKNNLRIQFKYPQFFKKRGFSSSSLSKLEVLKFNSWKIEAWGM